LWQDDFALISEMKAQREEKLKKDAEEKAKRDRERQQRKEELEQRRREKEERKAKRAQEAKEKEERKAAAAAAAVAAEAARAAAAVEKVDEMPHEDEEHEAVPDSLHDMFLSGDLFSDDIVGSLLEEDIEGEIPSFHEHYCYEDVHFRFFFFDRLLTFSNRSKY
jgi:phage protein D